LLRPKFWTNKNTKAVEPYFYREGKSGSAFKVQMGMMNFATEMCTNNTYFAMARHYAHALIVIVCSSCLWFESGIIEFVICINS
jgi:hypothetical protein